MGVCVRYGEERVADVREGTGREAVQDEIWQVFGAVVGLYLLEWSGC